MCFWNVKVNFTLEQIVQVQGVVQAQLYSSLTSAANGVGGKGHASQLYTRDRDQVSILQEAGCN